MIASPLLMIGEIPLYIAGFLNVATGFMLLFDVKNYARIVVVPVAVLNVTMFLGQIYGSAKLLQMSVVIVPLISIAISTTGILLSVLSAQRLLRERRGP